MLGVFVSRPLLGTRLPCVKGAPRGCGSAQNLVGHMTSEGILEQRDTDVSPTPGYWRNVTTVI